MAANHEKAAPLGLLQLRDSQKNLLPNIFYDFLTTLYLIRS
jgi:hypothetical protein